MKTVIELKTKNVHQRVQTHTYYTGEARRDAGIPHPFAARMMAGNDDAAQIDDHINSAVQEVASTLSRYLSPCEVERIKCCEEEQCAVLFIMHTPANFPHEAKGVLSESIENYTVYRTLQLWLMQHKPDEAMLAAQEAQMHAMRIREVLSLRSRPRIKRRKNKNNIEL